MKNLFPRKQSTLVFLFGAVLLAGCSQHATVIPMDTETIPVPEPTPTSAQGEYWPTDGWRTSTPEAQGMDGATLAGVVVAVKAQKLDLDSLLVIRNGYIVHETYFGSQSANQRHIQYSVTKSFISTLIGIALDRGSIERIDRPVLEFFPGLEMQNPDPRKEKMTLEDLLTMRSGLLWNDSDQDFENLFRSADWVQYMFDLPLMQTPGTVFTYCSGCTNLLSAVLQKAAGMTALDYARENLFGPLGITDLRWESDPSGTSIGGWGLYITPRDMAKLGYLYLHGGEWDGAQVVPADWVSEATREHTSTGGNLGYGYQWWTYPKWDAYAALGRDGQTIFVIPESDLIVVTTAGGVNHDRIFRLIEDFVYPALKG
jgi:CubicO group peptidase (beta-lactamase class C family)